MLECIGNKLVFKFPEIHEGAIVEVEFVRTLRIPDDDKTYPLPPHLGAFPLRNVDDFKGKLSGETVERGGVMIPMYQSEALWLNFRAHHVPRQGAYPFALKIGAGKRSAVTGNAWNDGLEGKDYVVVPVQPWLDGFMLDSGTIRQFVAAPLGAGYTVEEQLTGKAEFGGIQIEAFPMTIEEFNKRWPVRPDRGGIRMRSMVGGSGSDGFKSGFTHDGFDDVDGEPEYFINSNNVEPCTMGAIGPTRSVMRSAAAPKSMGMAAGGRMVQDIKADPYGLDVWDTDHSNRTFVHLFNSSQWRQITGEAPPTLPRTAEEYAAHHLPWFVHYSDGKDLKATKNTKKIKSAAQLDEEKDGIPLLSDNNPIKMSGKVIKTGKHSVKDGNW